MYIITFYYAVCRPALNPNSRTTLEISHLVRKMATIPGQLIGYIAAVFNFSHKASSSERYFDNVSYTQRL